MDASSLFWACGPSSGRYDEATGLSWFRGLRPTDPIAIAAARWTLCHVGHRVAGLCGDHRSRGRRGNGSAEETHPGPAVRRDILVESEAVCVRKRRQCAVHERREVSHAIWAEMPVLHNIREILQNLNLNMFFI